MAEVVTAGPSPGEGTQHPGSVVAALGDVLEALTRSTFDLNEVLHIVLDRAVRLCRADTADVALPDGEV